MPLSTDSVRPTSSHNPALQTGDGISPTIPLVRLATLADEEACWHIVHQAALDMVAKGRRQWDSRYPSRDVIHHDLITQVGYVVEDQTQVVAYCAITFDGEPAYNHLQGNWLTTGDYATLHRTAVARDHQGRGLARLFFQHTEHLCRQRHVGAIRLDTNYDNVEMLHRLQELGFTRCGICHYTRDGALTERIAFEKPLPAGHE